MSAAHGPLEALLTSDDGTIEAAMSTAALPNPNPVVWISFTGGSNESVSSFIQSIQRAAFQHGRITDDEWIAQLASTCFAEKALVWYLGLDKGTQSSWTKLRIALVKHYFVQKPVQEPKPNLTKTPVQPRAAPPQPKEASSAIAEIGRVEVLRPEFGNRLGFLSQDSTGKFVVDPSPDNALKLQKVVHTDSIHQQLKIYSLKFVNAMDPQFPFLGLKLTKFPGEDPDTVPQLNASSVSWTNIPYMPDCCKSSPSLTYKLDQYRSASRKTTLYATWDFAPTTESEPGPYYIRKAEAASQEDRVVSAVWTITSPVKGVAELGLTWPNGDNRLAGSISETRLDGEYSQLMVQAAY
ncbi:hypothetical protein FS837_012918 [Tulasnella sp. UAMH 9824]|nr:hypothetical protein FS837_012918 [Tulasnella sp. UAMH 9824]